MTYLVIAIMLIGVALWFAASYRALVGLSRSIRAAAETLAERLARRHQALGNLIELVSGELPKEPELARQLSEARAQAVAAAGRELKERQRLEDDLGERAGLLLAALQNDPAVGDDERYTRLRDAVLDAEDALTLARQDYNDLVVRFNARRTMLPARLFAARAGIGPVEEFNIGDFFARHPLQIKATLPTPGKSAFPRISRRAGSDSESSADRSTTKI